MKGPFGVSAGNSEAVHPRFWWSGHMLQAQAVILGQALCPNLSLNPPILSRLGARLMKEDTKVQKGPMDSQGPVKTKPSPMSPPKRLTEGPHGPSALAGSWCLDQQAGWMHLGTRDGPLPISRCSSSVCPWTGPCPSTSDLWRFRHPRPVLSAEADRGIFQAVSCDIPVSQMKEWAQKGQVDLNPGPAESPQD